jgi:hypothetical protein
MAEAVDPVLRLVAEETAVLPPPAVAEVAEAARQRHGESIVAILFYGSCLREQDDRGTLVDLYLLADRYRNVHRSRWMQLLNRLLPPNVYYIETSFEDRVIRAKYAIVKLSQFEKLVSRRRFEPYFWARFAQPTGLLWARSETVRQRVVAALAEATRTTIREIRPLLADRVDPERLWIRAFQETYATELRAERPGRAAALFRTFAQRYRDITDALLRQETAPVSDAARRRVSWRWRRRRVLGKLLSALRLLKAALTFEDGASYLIWKVQRHSGVRLELSPWQQRHPILASGVVFWRVYRAGGFR